MNHNEDGWSASENIESMCFNQFLWLKTWHLHFLFCSLHATSDDKWQFGSEELPVDVSENSSCLIVLKKPSHGFNPWFFAGFQNASELINLCSPMVRAPKREIPPRRSPWLTMTKCWVQPTQRTQRPSSWFGHSNSQAFGALDQSNRQDQGSTLTSLAFKFITWVE